MESMQERQVQVRFTTKLPSQFRVVNTPFSVPSQLTRYGLSEVINALLGLDKSEPFDFLVDGELLRTSLEQLMVTKKLSAESILNIEYAYAVAPPEQQSPRPHNDWVSAVDGSLPSFIFTGSYDSFVRIWTDDGELAQSLEGHTDAVTSVATITPAATSVDDSWKLVSGSKDQTIRVWQLSSMKSKDTSDHSVSFKESVRVLKGHTSSVQCVSSNQSGDIICSGSWDCSLRLWKVTRDVGHDEESAANKKRKLNGVAGSGQTEEIQVDSSALLEGHTQCVSAVICGERDVIVSASWDHSIRTWDAETGVNTESMTGDKALYCLSLGGEGSALLAAGGADPVLRIWDPRMPGTVAPILQLFGHKAWITACKWHQQSRYHIMSASHDGLIKLWDIRSKIPLLTVEAHKDKVLCADWWKPDCIVSGGADCMLQVFRRLQIS